MPNQEVQSLQDFYSFLTILIAVCAILSPVITAVVNNKHQKIMKELEYKQAEHAEKEQHIQQIYEGYIRETGACIRVLTGEQATKYGECLGLILYYVPDDIRKEILQLDTELFAHNSDSKITVSHLEKIAVKLRQLSKEKQ